MNRYNYSTIRIGTDFGSTIQSFQALSHAGFGDTLTLTFVVDVWSFHALTLPQHHYYAATKSHQEVSCVCRWRKVAGIIVALLLNHCISEYPITRGD